MTIHDIIEKALLIAVITLPIAVAIDLLMYYFK